MNGITLYEFGLMAAAQPGKPGLPELHAVPERVFNWLEQQCLRMSEEGAKPWARLVQRAGRRAVQVTNFVGVIRTPDGFQIEVLPKVGKAIDGGVNEARNKLIEMLRCLGEFRHLLSGHASLETTAMPLFEIFIADFLRCVSDVVKCGVRSDYSLQEGNLPTLRGKLLMSQHLRLNLCRADRFYTEYDLFSANRPENRLLHAALREVLRCAKAQANQQLARELCFVFADVPAAQDVAQEFQRVRLDRGMAHYGDALAWARLILEKEAPLTGVGKHAAPSLLFPMEAVFEAYVTKHLAAQLVAPYALKSQASSLHMVRHQSEDWFKLKPDLLLRRQGRNRMVLDTKWKLLDSAKSNAREKYGLAQSDFYQLQAYGHSYLEGQGDIVLIYPRTDRFSGALPVFEFPRQAGMRLWVLPFCLKERCLVLPQGPAWHTLVFKSGAADPA